MTQLADAIVRSDPFEVATCWAHGFVPDQRRAPTTTSPREALAGVIRPALLDGPCYVTFSGGRDSSAVLAAATALARAEGLADPVPVTRRYPHIPDTDENEWQELVVSHLGLRDWIRLDLTDDETDLLGPTAQASIRRHGVLFPPALHSHGVVYQHMRGGSMLTGEGGDEVLGARRVTPLTLLRRRRTPTLALLRRACDALLPRPLRAAAVRHELPVAELQSWLLPDAANRHSRMLAAAEATEPLRFSDAIAWVGRKRVWHTMDINQRIVASDYDVRAINPLIHPDFLAALARAGGFWGYNGRTSVMKALFADVLPPSVLTRGSKGAFNRAYSGRYTQAFAREWDGTGVDTSLVDVVALRSQWLSDTPTMSAAMLLHSAWLGTQNNAEASS
ncbi:asparagine synthase-related protein [Pseudactinotalea terrae]|uniref:asparagine synthase-related protein n=1 Tax=Pseudactinotalea terrae TaxID=1743262 RepID=UPI0012E20FD5|nr:asparagine synthase-related protein [Pseudactinotalea terrae]